MAGVRSGLSLVEELKRQGTVVRMGEGCLRLSGKELTEAQKKELAYFKPYLMRFWSAVRRFPK